MFLNTLFGDDTKKGNFLKLLQVVTAQLVGTSTKGRNLIGNKLEEIETNVTITWSNRDIVYGKSVGDDKKVALRLYYL